MTTSTSLWLRAENKPGEARTPLTPADAAALVAAGMAVTIEESAQRVFPLADYRAAGCRTAAPGGWRQAPGDCYILGLKELPDERLPLRHRHIYFAHAFKEQQGWRQLLSRFVSGGGVLLDLEYLQDAGGRRLAAFGYWAGYVGAALAALAWARQCRNRSPVLAAVTPWPGRDALLAECRQQVQAALAVAGDRPQAIIIGALGRVGSGALQLCRELELPTTAWDLAETATGGPFEEIMQHELFINCVLVSRELPPFITRSQLPSAARRLRVVADVSCDPYGTYNPVPLYSRCTTTERPSLRLLESEPPLDLIAIDNLPSLLPRESSEDFSAQLLPSLQALGEAEQWRRAEALFRQHCERLVADSVEDRR